MRWLLGALALGVLLAAVGAAWLLGTQAGLQWAATQLEAADRRLALQGLRGALAGEIAFEEIRFAEGATRVRLAKGALRLEPLALLRGRAGLRYLRAETLEIGVGGGGGERPAPPALLPLGVGVEQARIERIRIGDLTIEDFELDDALLNQRAQLVARAAFAVRDAAYPAQLQLRLDGTLERLEAAISARVAGVPLTAKAVLAPFEAQPLRGLDAQGGPLDLRQLRDGWPRTALTLRASGSAQGAQFAGTLALRNAEPGPLDAQRAPLTALQTRFSTDFTSATLRDLRITGAGNLVGSARLSRREATLELRADALDLRALHSTLHRTRLEGPLTLRLTEERQEVQGTLSQQDMSLTAEAVRRGDQLEIRSLRAQAEGGEATGSARLQLGEPLRFETTLRLARFDPARFGDYPQGSINGRVQASGAYGKSLAMQASWTVADSTLYGQAFASTGNARVSGERVPQLDAQASLGRARLGARGSFGASGDSLALELEVPDVAQFIEDVAGKLTASAQLTGSWQSPRGSVRARASKLALPNDLVLEAVSASATGSLGQHEGEIQVQADGIDASAQLRGGWQGAAAGWRGALQALRNTGPYPLRLLSPAPLEVSREHLAIGRFEASLDGGRLLVGRLDWRPSSLTSSGEFERLPAQWLLLAAGLTDRARASLLLDGRWDLAAAPRLSGTLALRRTAGDLVVLPDGQALGLESAALEARFTDGAAEVTAALASKYGSAEAKGALRGFAADSPVEFTARVRFAELRTLLQPFIEDARVDGRLVAELQGGGTLGRIGLRGSIQGEAIGLQMPPYGVFLKDGELRAVLEGDRLRVERFTIAGSSGRLTASGTLPLRAEGDAHLDWRAESFGILARPDLRLTVSGAGAARLAGRKVFLSGALRADRGYLELEQQRLPQLGDDVVIAGRARPVAREPASVPVGLDVQLDLGDQLEVRGYGLEGKLTGKLQVETTQDGNLRAYGRIQTLNATFFAYGQRLQVDPGIAIFDGPLDNPGLQMTAWRRNQQVEAGVQVSGTARSPRVQLVSQPPVPEAERLSWLVLGRAPGEANKADLGLLQAAAGALLARGDQMPLDRRLARTFGLDEISLRGSGEVGDQVVAVGKRLSDRLYVSYEQGIGVLASSLVKLDLSLTQRLSVRAETGTSSGLGLFYRFSWD